MTQLKPHFIQQLIEKDIAKGRCTEIITRFPPEPNGYLHIGHAKSICLNFDMALLFKGKCYLRFDDTNPIKEEEEYVQSIIEDVKWLGYEWEAITHSSDYYQTLYDFALHLIDAGKAYVDSLSMEEIRAYRGTLQEPGKDSPYRNRTVEENRTLFEAMRDGKYPDGTHVLRAKIDMRSPNLNMRDPVLYRIRHTSHQRTGDTWCIYPMYDYAHPISDALEYVTHSLCTLEFQDHRPLYDWFIENTKVPAHPIQTEFARLNVSHTITSKRKLRMLVEEKHVEGWDDPRLLTIRGMRRRGYPPEAIRQFCTIIGVSRADSVIDMTVLEDTVRNVLNASAPRAMAVLKPLKVVIDNYPEDKTELLTVPAEGNWTRTLPFGREIYIEQDDFMEEPVSGYFRLAPDKEVRLRHAYIIRCVGVERDAQGHIVCIHATYDTETLGKNPTDRKVKGVIHWVHAHQNHPVQVIQYDRLFLDPNPGAHDDFARLINPDSISTCEAIAEASLANPPDSISVFQFERLGYYAVHGKKANSVSAFHRVVSLRNTWEKLQSS